MALSKTLSSSSVLATTLWALLALSVSAEAQPGWSGIVSTLSAVDLRANDAELAVDAAGNAFAIWTRGSGASEVVQVARYTAATFTWSGPISLSAVGLEFDDPRVAFDPSGNAMASWIRFTGVHGVVQTARYDVATNSWGAGSDLPGGDEAIFPEIVLDHAGNAVATWHHFESSISQYFLRSARYSASTGWGSVSTIGGAGNGALGGGRSMVVDSAGDVTVVWSVNQNHTQYSIQAIRYTAASQIWGTETPLALNGVGDSRKPSVAIDGAGNVMAIWEFFNGTTARLQTARYSKAANSWSAAANIPSAAAGAESERLAVAPSGDAIAIWEQSVGGNDILQAAHFSAATGTWSAATSLSPAAQDSEEAELAVDQAGNAIAIWARRDGSASSIRAANYTRSTNIWTSPLTLSPAGHVADDPRVSFDAAGNAVAIWEAFDGTQDVIRATHWIASAGGLASPANLRAVSIVGNTVTIAWETPAGSQAPTDHLLEGGVSSGQVLASVPTGGSATTFTFVAPTGAFYIRVHALAGTARSAASNEIRIFVNVPTPPSAPVNLAGQANGSTLSLTWQNTAAGGTPTAIVLDVTGSISTSFNLPVSESLSFARVPNGTYTLAVRAVNASGTSAASNPVTLTFPGPCATPGVPTNFVATRSGNTVSVSWAAPTGGATATGYTLIVTGSFVGSFPTTGLALAGTVPAGSYTLSVVATNACGASAATAPQTVTIP